ncbi:MAG: hypothetical protein FWE93_00050 [Alphaproteobacteria bacterium]|nr:hypothetical protein [Alphaproteobacteria bacterium]
MSDMPNNKVNVYGKNQKLQAEQNIADSDEQPDSREIDARALLKYAGQLNEAKAAMEKDPKDRNNSRAYAEAIRANQRLWTIFQVAMIDPENGLPIELKNNILTLSTYVDKTSFQAIANYSPKTTDSLININKTIAAGLKPATSPKQGF